MSRVRSLMVSSVMELFWRRCLHGAERNPVNQLFLQSALSSWRTVAKPPPAAAIELETNFKAFFFFAYLATFLLDSLLPALDGGEDKTTGKVVRKSGEIEEGDAIC